VATVAVRPSRFRTKVFSLLDAKSQVFEKKVRV
jgi:hypothetical protein